MNPFLLVVEENAMDDNSLHCIVLCIFALEKRCALRVSVLDL